MPALHKIPVRVFRWKQTELRSRCTSNVGDMPCPFAPKCINMNVDLLVRLHVAKLGLPEVGGDPHIVERDELHHVLAGLNILAGSHRAMPDNSLNRGDYFCVAKI